MLFKNQMLESVFHHQNGYGFPRFSSRESPLWAIIVKQLATGRNRRVTGSEASRPPVFRPERTAGGDLKLAWEWEHVAAGDAAAALHVRVTGRMPARGGLTAWRMEVDNPGQGLAVGEVEFPVIGNIGKKRGATASDYFGIPFKSGVLMQDPAGGGGLDDKNEGVYGNLSMQLLPYWFEGSGLYLGTYDPDGYHKRWPPTTMCRGGSRKAI